MKRLNSGEWLLLAVVIVLVLAAVFTILRMTWLSPEIRDVPATVTPTVRVIVLPTFTPAPAVTMLATPVVPVLDLLPRETATRAPTLTVTPAPTATPVPPTPDKPAVQRG